MVNRQLSYRFLLSTPAGAIWVNGVGRHGREVPDAADFRLATDPAPPGWVAGAVFYEVFIDRFARGTRGHVDTDAVHDPVWAIPAEWGDPVVHGHPDAVRQLYRGDLWGVAEHLDHLVALGVTAVYLTPFFPADSNHRYDATSFDCVDSVLGGDEALAHLVRRAAESGVRVVGDLTLNHTGDRHDWFVRARADAASPQARFYLFRKHPDAYQSFADVPSLPKLDHRSDELRRRLFEGPGSVVARYLREPRLGGWRIDVAQSAGHAGGSNRTQDSARATRAAMLAVTPDAYLVAEHQFDASAALAGDGWHGTMAYASFTRPVWSWLADRRRHVHEVDHRRRPARPGEPAGDPGEHLGTGSHPAYLLGEGESQQSRSPQGVDRLLRVPPSLVDVAGVPRGHVENGGQLILDRGHRSSSCSRREVRADRTASSGTGDRARVSPRAPAGRVELVNLSPACARRDSICQRHVNHDPLSVPVKILSAACRIPRQGVRRRGERRLEEAAGTRSHGMTKYLISFDGAMTFVEEELPDVADAVRAVRVQAKDAGVWVCPLGWNIRCRASWPHDGTVTDGPDPEPRSTSADSRSSTCPHARRRWSGLPRSPPPAAVRKRSLSSCPTRPSEPRRPATPEVAVSLVGRHMS